MWVSSVRIYPVKSTAGTDVPAATVDRWGLRGDRRWMVVTPDGTVITARERPVLLTVRPVLPGLAGTPGVDELTGADALTGSDVLTLTAPGSPTLLVPVPTGPPDVPVTLSRLGTATAAGPAADAWISAVLGEPARLVWLDDPARRPVAPAHGGADGDPLSLADAGPLLLTSATSLTRLDSWAAEEADARGEERPEPLSMVRFRPNVVVEGAGEPFAEDAWQRVRIGDVEYRQGELCDRCILPLYDPVTLSRGKEPLRSLARHRRWDHQTWFGVRLIPLSTGAVRVGDEVVVG